METVSRYKAIFAETLLIPEHRGLAPYALLVYIAWHYDDLEQTECKCPDSLITTVTELIDDEIVVTELSVQRVN